MIDEAIEPIRRNGKDYYRYTHRGGITRTMPVQLTEINRWCCVRVTEPESDETKKRFGKRDKLPCDINDNGMTKDAIANLNQGYDENHVVFRFTGKPEANGKVLAFVDGDGKPLPEHQEFYINIRKRFSECTYTEWSLSAELDKTASFHAVGYVDLSRLKKHHPKLCENTLSIEIYARDSERWCVMTGIVDDYDNRDKFGDMTNIINDLIDKGYELTPSKKKPEPKTKPNPGPIETPSPSGGRYFPDKLRISKSDDVRVMARLKWHIANKATNPLCPNYNSFLQTVHSLKWMGYPNNLIERFCSQQPNFDGKAISDIRSIKTPSTDQTASFFDLSNKAGCTDQLAFDLSPDLKIKFDTIKNLESTQSHTPPPEICGFVDSTTNDNHCESHFTSSTDEPASKVSPNLESTQSHTPPPEICGFVDSTTNDNHCESHFTSSQDETLDRTFLTKTKPDPLGFDVGLDCKKINMEELSRAITIGDFVPARHRVGLYCGRDNVGKTAWLIYLASLLTRIGQRVLYITTDQDAEDLTPYLLGFEANVDLLHVESVKSKVFVKPDLVSLCMVFQKEIGQFPDLLILDSIADITIEAAASFMPEDDKGRQPQFNEYRAADWKLAFSRFINPLAIRFNCAILGTLHSTPKGETSEHAVPLSHRLPGLVEFVFMCFDRDVSVRGAWDRDLIQSLKQCETDTRLLFCRRTRSNNSRRHFFYDLGDQTKQRMGKSCVRHIVNVRPAVPKKTETPNLQTPVTTVDAICYRVAKRARGYGEQYKITETEALKALNCYESMDRRLAEDAIQRRDLYFKAKVDCRIMSETNHKGTKVWVPDLPKDPDKEREKYRSRGYQY